MERGGLFEDTYKGLPRLNVSAHGNNFGNIAAGSSGNLLWPVMFSKILNKNFNASNYKNIRLLICYSGDNQVCSVGQVLSTASGAFLGTVSIKGNGIYERMLDTLYVDGMYAQYIEKGIAKQNIVAQINSMLLQKQTKFHVKKNGEHYHRVYFDPILNAG